MKISNTKGNLIPSELFGLFFEDINFAADGGLYAEMIENRSFEAKEGFGNPNNFYTIEDCGYAWSSYSKNENSEPVLQYIMGTPLSEVNPHYLRVTATEPGQGFSNKAYDGICMTKGSKYQVSFYARCVEYSGENFQVSIHKDGKEYATGSVKAITPVPYLPFADLTIEMPAAFGDFAKLCEKIQSMDPEKHCRYNDWIKYEVTITAEENVSGAIFSIVLEDSGVVEFDLISMMPEDAVAGIFRKDLFQALYDMKPGFIRFPGGCIVEGISLENRYRWKATVGELKDRKYIPNLWAFDDDRTKTSLNVQRPDAHYGQSFGIGFYEYFLLCELLGAKPLPVLNIGAACQFRSTELVPIGSEAFQEYVQDALDLIEFANGPVDSKWGSLRAEMGHPAPFNLEMVAIGNEQWESKYFDLFDRYRIFEKAIHEVYPEMKLVGTAGPTLDLPMTDLAWEFHRKEDETNKMFCYAVDEHYYVSPQWMYDHVAHYDNYPRTVGVFAGEYAAHTTEKENNMESALSEAALLTGIERNADVVKLASYAPLFNRIGHTQWTPDMIWFDDENVYLTPNYYVQKLFSVYKGKYIMPLDGQEKTLRENNIYVSLTLSETGEYILKAVNAGNTDYELDLQDALGQSVAVDAAIITLEATGKLFSILSENVCKSNLRTMPEETVLTETQATLNGSVTLKGKTFQVIRFSL